MIIEDAIRLGRLRDGVREAWQALLEEAGAEVASMMWEAILLEPFDEIVDDVSVAVRMGPAFERSCTWTGRLVVSLGDEGVRARAIVFPFLGASRIAERDRDYAVWRRSAAGIWSISWEVDDCGEYSSISRISGDSRRDGWVRAVPS